MPIDTRHPREIRRDIRNGKLTGVTAGVGANHVQANLAVLPRDYAYDFLLFCQRNPRPCPLLEVTDVGSAEPVGVAPGADLRTDIPRYRIYTHGELTDEVTDATPYWRDDLVAFLLGCSFTFEWALLEAGVRLWHVEHGKNVAMWRTSIPTFLPCSTCQRRMPASSSAHSNVNEQPSRNATRSSRQYGVASVTSSVSSPCV